MPDSVRVRLTSKGNDPDKWRDRLYQLRQKVRGGFKKELTEFGLDVVYPWIVEHWPRDFWQPLAESTVKEKERLGYGGEAPLVRESKLYDAATTPNSDGSIFEVSPYALWIGVDADIIPYATYQFAGTPNAAYPIPARPWLLEGDIEKPEFANKLWPIVNAAVKKAVEGSPDTS